MLMIKYWDVCSDMRSNFMRFFSKDKLLKYMMIYSMVIFLLVVMVLPLITLFTTAFKNQADEYVGIQNILSYLSSEATKYSLKNTISVSLWTTVITVILAFLYAYGLTRTNMKAKGVFKYIALLPLFAPTMLYGIALIYLFGNKGLVTMYLGIDIGLYGFKGIVISEVLYAFPQVLLILYISLKTVDFRLYEASETLGVSNIKKFFYITLPSIKYSIISSAFVSFTLSFTDFGAPKVVGGSYNVLATDIFKQVVGQQNINMGAVVGIILLIPALLSFVVDRFSENKRKDGAVNAKSVDYKIKNNRLRDRFMTLYCSLISFFFLALIFMIVYVSLVKIWPYDLSITFSNYTFNNSTGDGLAAYTNSLKMSLITAFIGTIISFSNAYIIEKFKELKLLRTVGYLISIVPLAVPGLVIGLSYIFFFNSPNNPFNSIYGTMAILVLANVFHFYSVPFITSMTAMKKLDKEFEDVSESLSLPFYKTLFKVTIPMSITALLEIFMYYFTNSMVTISALVFLYSPELKLATISMINLDDAGNTSSAAALGVLIIITNIIARCLYEILSKKLVSERTNKKETQVLIKTVEA